eukprot:gene23007-biopygen14837
MRRELDARPPLQLRERVRRAVVLLLGRRGGVAALPRPRGAVGPARAGRGAAKAAKIRCAALTMGGRGGWLRKVFFTASWGPLTADGHSNNWLRSETMFASPSHLSAWRRDGGQRYRGGKGVTGPCAWARGTRRGVVEARGQKIASRDQKITHGRACCQPVFFF